MILFLGLDCKYNYIKHNTGKNYLGYVNLFNLKDKKITFNTSFKKLNNQGSEQHLFFMAEGYEKLLFKIVGFYFN